MHECLKPVARAVLLGGALALSTHAGVRAAVAEWPGWRGPNRDAVSTETGLLGEWKAPGPPLAWKATGLGAGFSSVAIAGGRIFTMGDHEGKQHVFALSQTGRRSGRRTWGPLTTRRTAARAGRPPWTASSSTPSAPTATSCAWRRRAAKERWRKSLVRDFGGRVMSGWKFSESPLVDGDRLVVTPGAKDGALVALDKKTGRELWRTAIPDLGPQGKDGAAYSSVVVSNAAGVRQYVQLLGRGLVGVRASDGAFLWGYNRIANNVANISTPIVRANWVFASTGYQTGSVLLELHKTAEGGVAARELYFLDGKTLQSHHGGLVLVGNHVYGGHGQKAGFPICVEFTTGKVVWGGNIRNAGSGSAAVLYADGNLYFRYENGTMLLVQATPEGYHERGSFTIPDVGLSWSHPVIVDGRLYLREQDRLYCYDVRRS